ISTARPWSLCAALLIAVGFARVGAPDGAQANHEPGGVVTVPGDFATLQEAVTHIGTGAGTILLTADLSGAAARATGIGQADLVIRGACDPSGQPLTTLDGSNGGSVLVIGGTLPVHIECVRITGGLSGFGGAGIRNSGTLRIVNSVISGNTTSGSSLLLGGGIRNTGTL